MTISELETKLQAELQAELPRLAKMANAQERIDALNALTVEAMELLDAEQTTIREMGDMAQIKQRTRRQIRQGMNQPIESTWSWELY
jgi:hypothetical protein